MDGDWFKGMEDAGYQRRFGPYNGGFGREQLDWFRSQLKAAAATEERVLVMSHVILHPDACGGGTMALDVIRSEEAAGCVAAVLCGHDHKGNYHCDEFGVHHFTFISPLSGGKAFGLMNVEKGHLEIQAPIMNDFLP